MNIRQLQFLVALSQEQHFARAAARCNISQPTLSSRIRQLEEELGVPIVERDKRYIGLTPEGTRVLDWAKRILADCDSLEQELSELKGSLTGSLTMGVIPSALPAVSLLTSPFCAAHPGVRITVQSRTSVEIERQLHNFEIEIGMTYVDNEPLSHVKTLPLYQEHYVLITSAQGPLTGQDSVSWQKVAEIPLCLLTPDMQNRRIVDEAFRQAGCEVTPQVEANSLTALYSHVRFGHWSCVLPQTYGTMVGLGDDLKAIPITAPAMSHSVGLIASDRDPPSPLANAMMIAAAKLDLTKLLNEL
ncbi:LysR family transcriptional regulator [Pelagibius sp. Alg239-R121]|uniref:LysR family transcriptional regulator n=1 Tax=Pelagibius sp. Alg239-R121 TaxID=2993448 RepID=UPI0024A6E4E3|nr:LysR family transcriptional regulator [Pelagibius sp. Alg239-R121]